jgi:hypothetical protein
MKSFIRKFIEAGTRKPQVAAANSESNLTPYKYAKSYRELTITVKRLLRDLLLMTMGVFFCRFWFQSLPADQ